jgi:hypothetical protein
MRQYLAVPTYLTELFVVIFTLFWAAERWFLNIRHSGTHFSMWFLTSAQQMFLLILPSKG